MHFRIDEYHDAGGPIQKLNPALKLAFMVIIPLAASLSPASRPEKLFMLLLFTVALAAFSRVPLKAFVKRSLPAVPFAAYAAMVFVYCALYGRNLFMADAGPAASAFGTASGGFYSLAGFRTLEQAFALCLLLKILITLNAVVVFTASTSFRDLSCALRSFGAPTVFIKLFGACWRYLQDIINEILSMECASRLRFFSPKSLLKVKTFAMMISSLFIKSINRAELNNISMKLRGGGGISPDRPFQGRRFAPLAPLDVKFMALSAMVATAVYMI